MGRYLHSTMEEQGRLCLPSRQRATVCAASAAFVAKLAKDNWVLGQEVSPMYVVSHMYVVSRISHRAYRNVCCCYCAIYVYLWQCSSQTHPTFSTIMP